VTRQDFLRRLEAAVRELADPRGGIVVACSGGPDSTALLFGLAALRERLGAALTVAHLNHRLRAEADSDEAFVRGQAERLGLPFAAESRAVADIAAAEGRSVEDAGRRERYAFLERVARSAGAATVATAHTADDQAETVLHRIARGTGLRGLGGIPASRSISAGSAVTLIRPLLSFRKADLLAWLSAEGIAFVRDASNDSADFTRNRIRGRVLPVLAEEVNPDSATALTRLAEIARWADEHLSAEAAAALPSCIAGESAGVVELSWPALVGLSAILRTEVIRLAAERLTGGSGGGPPPGFDALKAAATLPPGGATEFPGGLRVERRGKRLRLLSRRPAQPPSSEADSASR
jgi:tRNA(Ile)-lysidine synthase